MSTTTLPFTGTFLADPVHSSFTFAITHMGVGTFRSSFDEVEARVVAEEHGIRFDGSARVESISIRQPPEFRDHVVFGTEFFDAGHHPQITFRSDDVQLGDDGSAVINGELTMRGIMKPFSAHGTYRPLVEDPYGNVRTAVEFTATVDRRDWEMNWQAPLPNGGDALGYSVELRANVELLRQGEPE